MRVSNAMEPSDAQLAAFLARAGDGQVGGPGGNRSSLMRDVQQTTDHRSVFLPIVRDLVPESLALFDYAEPSMVTGKRDVTTVPSQALYLMNGPFAQEQAQKTLEFPLYSGITDPGHKITRLYRYIYGRKPDLEEMALALKYVEEDTPKIWASYVKTLLLANEFVFID
mgnify:CR=1 FL=1